MSLRTIWAIARKDLLEALRTLRLLIFILLPIGFSLFYRTVFSSAGDITTARVVVFDAGRSRLAQVMGQTEGIRIIIVSSVEELERMVVEARAVGGVALPPDYDAALIAGQRPPIRLWVNEQLEIQAAQFIRLIEPALRALARQQPPARVETITVNGNLESNPRPGFDLQRFLLIMFLTVGMTTTAVMIPASMLVEEKEQRTLQAVLATRATYTDLVVGKGSAGLVYALLCGGIILILNGGLSGDVGLASLALALTSVFLVAVGLLLGALFDSLSALNTWSFVALLPLTLPGVVVPAANLGLLDLGAAAWALRLIPTYYTVDAVQRAVSGVASLEAVGGDLLALSVSALLLFVATVMALRRREK